MCTRMITFRKDCLRCGAEQAMRRCLIKIDLGKLEEGFKCEHCQAQEPTMDTYRREYGEA